MDFLVTMTTRVPEGTSEAAVDGVRTREAAHSRQLAAEGHLLRLWRPPLQPGQWRTLGLFASDDAAHLESVLASMPLRVWRTDEVTPLLPHPNDPAGPTGTGPAAGADADREFLTAFTIAVPPGTPDETIEAADDREADRARELAAAGNLSRLWTLPGEGRTLGLWRAHDDAAMEAIVASLPLVSWMDVQTTPLSPHPSDPALAGS